MVTVAIRAMDEADVPAVSELRVRGWQWAYAGIVPDGYLAAMDPEQDAARRRELFATSRGRSRNLLAVVRDGTAPGANTASDFAGDASAPGGSTTGGGAGAGAAAAARAGTGGGTDAGPEAGQAAGADGSVRDDFAPGCTTADDPARCDLAPAGSATGGGAGAGAAAAARGGTGARTDAGPEAGQAAGAGGGVPERVVGWAAFGPYRGEPDGTADGELYALYLRPEWAGRGIGRALMSEVVRQAAAQGRERLLLWVLADNTRARRFYAAAGFTPDGTEATDTFDGVPLRELRYARDLGDADRAGAPEQPTG